MSIEYIYDQLNSDDLDNEQWSTLVRYLDARIRDLPQSDSGRTEIAYEIAGLLSTKYAMSLEDGDILEQVLSLAGELEIQSPDNEKKWFIMRGLVRKLLNQVELNR